MAWTTRSQKSHCYKQKLCLKSAFLWTDKANTTAIRSEARNICSWTSSTSKRLARRSISLNYLIRRLQKTQLNPWTRQLRTWPDCQAQEEWCRQIHLSWSTQNQLWKTRRLNEAMKVSRSVQIALRRLTRVITVLEARTLPWHSKKPKRAPRARNRPRIMPRSQTRFWRRRIKRCWLQSMASRTKMTRAVLTASIWRAATRTIAPSSDHQFILGWPLTQEKTRTKERSFRSSTEIKEKRSSIHWPMQKAVNNQKWSQLQK